MMSLLAVQQPIFTIFSFMLCVCEGAENVFTASKGETVNLHCHSPLNDTEQVSVEWTKHNTNSTAICKFNINNISRSFSGDCIPRFKFNRESFTLSIENVQLSDSGHYSCKTTILIPPPTLDNTTYVTLKVEARLHLSLQKLSSSNNTCIHLICSLEGLKPELVNFTWSRAGLSLLHPFTSNTMKTELRLCKPDWSKEDTITCYANYSSTQTPYSRNITLDFSHEGQTEIHLPVCAVLFGIFIISIVFIWMLFFIFKYKSVTCCRGPST